MSTRPSLLYLVDDGWRYEKQELLEFLKHEGVEMGIITHDPVTQEYMESIYPTELLPVYSIKDTLRYKVNMFFAREFDTFVFKCMELLRYHEAGFFTKLIMRLRSLTGVFGLRTKTYVEVLEKLYANSDKYTEVLEGCEAIVFSPVAMLNKRIVFEAKRRGIKLIYWVYSWDNPFKDNEFIPWADHYLVWNEQNKNDVRRLFDIPEEKINIVGPSQFDYLLDNRKRQLEPPPEKYALLAFTMGLSFYVEQEIEQALHLRRILDDINPDIMLYVRPYPFCDSENPYEALKDVPGIKVLDYGDNHGGRVYMTKKDLVERFEQIQQAECFINFASTIVLEASFTTTPIIQMKFNWPTPHPWHQKLELVLGNDHLKYIMDYDFPNITHDEDQLTAALSEVLTGNQEPYMEYSKQLQIFSHPLETDSYKKIFLENLIGCITFQE